MCNTETTIPETPLILLNTTANVSIVDACQIVPPLLSNTTLFQMKTCRITSLPSARPSKALRTLLRRLREHLNRYRDELATSHHWNCTMIVARSKKNEPSAEPTVRLSENVGKRFISQLSWLSLIPAQHDTLLGSSDAAVFCSSTVGSRHS